MRIQYARKQAELLLSRLGITGVPTPVEKVAEELGLRVVRAQLGESVSGLLVTKGNESLIAVRHDDSERAARVTIAHEIGHFVLRHQVPGELVHVDNGEYLVSRMSSRGVLHGKPKEVEANQFAGALLMPERQIVAWFHRMNITLLTEAGIHEFSEDFEVSIPIAMLRLNALGYF
jgi:Zn-dependent peptidase ImmA (M78 family)